MKKFCAEVLKDATETLSVTMVPGQSAVGGGSGPNVHPPTTLIALKHQQLTARSNRTTAATLVATT